MITYKIEPYGNLPGVCALFSEVDSDFGTRAARNFICQGTYQYCEDMQRKLENIQ